MQLTRTADYAIRVMIHLAGLPSGARASRETLADWAQVPGEFLAKVLQSLTRARLVNSHRGARGGFDLARDSASISLLHVVEAIEGPFQLNVCLQEDSACGRRWWCAAHGVWKEAQAAMTDVLARATIDQLAAASFSVPGRESLTQLEPTGPGGTTPRWN